MHDIGRFEEIKVTQEMNSLKFDHAYYGAKILFDDGLIRNFIEDSQYDNIIRKAIENHSKIKIEDGLDERCLLHAKIIRDADKLDNYRVKIEENIESVFPKKVKDKEALEYSTMSNKIYEAVLARQCVDIRYRVTPLDFWVSILAFTFDLNFNASYQVVKENNYINILIDKFNYQIPDSKEKMESVRNILNKFVEKKLNE